jgi:hypothetical protein
MDALGWRQATFARLATPKEVDPNLFARTVDVTLVEFDNAEGATAALPAMEDILVERRRAERAAAPVVGEEAVALRYTGVAEGSGVRYDVLRLLFRRGRWSSTSRSSTTAGPRRRWRS